MIIQVLLCDIHREAAGIEGPNGFKTHACEMLSAFVYRKAAAPFTLLTMTGDTRVSDLLGSIEPHSARSFASHAITPTVIILRRVPSKVERLRDGSYVSDASFP